MVVRSGVRYIHIAPAPGNHQPVSLANIGITAPGAPSVSLAAQATLQLTATATDFFGHALSTSGLLWSSSNTGVATISASGLVTGVAIGTAIITASLGGIFSTITVSVTQAQDGSIADVRGTIGDSSFAALWDMSSAYVTQSSGAVSVADARGPNYPVLTLNGAAHPAYDAVNGEVSLNGTDQYGASAPDAAFDHSRPITIVVLGSVISGGSNGYAGVGRDLALTAPYMALAQFGVFSLIGGSNNAQSRTPVDTAKHVHIGWIGSAKGGVTTTQPTIGIELANHLNNVVQVNAPASGNNIAFIGRNGGAYAQMAVRAYVIIRGEPSAATWAAIRRYAVARGLTIAVATNRALFIGDSLTSGFGSTAGNEYPTILAGAILPGYEWNNFGVAGRQVSELALLADSVYVPQVFGPKTLAYLWGGTNDLNVWDNGTIISNLQSCCSKLKAAGAVVLIGTITNRNDTNVATNQAVVNAAIRAFASGGYADRVVDLQADSRLANPNDTTYFNGDKLHFNNTGYGVIASLFQAASSGLT